MLPIYTNMLPIYCFVTNMLPIYCSANICYANTFLLDVRLNFWKETVRFVCIYPCSYVINRGKVRKKIHKNPLLSILFMFQFYPHFSCHSSLSAPSLKLVSFPSKAEACANTVWIFAKIHDKMSLLFSH